MRNANLPIRQKREIAILGFGAEGQSVLRFLKRSPEYKNAEIWILDKNTALKKPAEKNIYLQLGASYLKNLPQFDVISRSPGIPYLTPEIQKARRAGSRISSVTKLFFNEFLKRRRGGSPILIGVTGSKGKGTTCTLLNQIFKKAGFKTLLLGNIGKPMLEHLMLSVKKGKIFVLELSSYQLDDIKFSPDISVLTNLFLEHLDYHKSLNNYYQAKKNIINFQNENGFFVYNPDNKESVKWLKDYKGNKIAFFEKIPVKEEDIHLMGKHNQNNIRAAISVAKILTRSNNFAKNKISQRLFDRVKISDKVISSAIKNFKGLPNRLELVGKFKGIIFYNDASSTNPDSSILAIESLKDIDTIFLGGQDRGYDFSHLEKVIKKYKIRNIVLFPDSGEKIIKNKSGLNILNTESMEEAVKFAYQNTLKGKICLLSGASPSYSLWKNFEEKGDQFKHFVKKLNKQ